MLLDGNDFACMPGQTVPSETLSALGLLDGTGWGQDKSSSRRVVNIRVEVCASILSNNAYFKISGLREGGLPPLPCFKLNLLSSGLMPRESSEQCYTRFSKLCCLSPCSLAHSRASVREQSPSVCILRPDRRLLAWSASGTFAASLCDSGPSGRLC